MSDGKLNVLLIGKTWKATRDDTRKISLCFAYIL